MYKIKVKKTGIGYKLTLYKKCFFIWIPDMVSNIKTGYEGRVDTQINEWVNHLNIPKELVHISEDCKI